jgi:hypothetical protein
MANEQLVKKLTLTAYTDITCKTKIKDPFDIVLQVNPTEIAVSFRHRMKIIVNSNIQ